MSNVDWDSLPRKRDALYSGGGGGTFDQMEARVKALEDKFEKVDSKLDTIIGELSSVRTDIAYLKGKIEGMPSAQAFGELKGRVESLPTTAKVAAIIGIAVGILTLLTRWTEISAWFAN